jgi:hypothetical protein
VRRFPEYDKGVPSPTGPHRAAAALLIAAALLPAACKSVFQGGVKEPDPLPVTRAAEEVVVAAWSEPKELPPGGGQAQILVRAQKRGGAPFPGVEVRLSVSGGSLFSGGKVLVTDATGRTRDRLTASRLALVTVNAGGTVYRFRVPLRAAEAE